jgi:hypothetical protein
VSAVWVLDAGLLCWFCVWASMHEEAQGLNQPALAVCVMRCDHKGLCVLTVTRIRVYRL